MTAEEEEQERILQKLTIPTMEEVARHHPDDPNAQLMLDEARKASIYYHRPPPYRTPGLAALAAGIGSFFIGGLIWLRYSNRWRRSHWVKVNDDA